MQVDQWLDFSSALTSGAGLEAACGVINHYLSLRTFLVDFCLTVADVACWGQLQGLHWHFWPHSSCMMQAACLSKVVIISSCTVNLCHAPDICLPPDNDGDGIKPRSLVMGTTMFATHVPGCGCLEYCRKHCKGLKLGQSWNLYSNHSHIFLFTRWEKCRCLLVALEWDLEPLLHCHVTCDG